MEKLLFSRASRVQPLLRLLSEPVAWLALVAVMLVVLLSLRLVIPIGPMYWDTYIYLDAAQRIWTGQIPSVDFSTPVGPLGYYLFAWGLELFPKAQPLLLAQWCLLAVAGPLMAIVLCEVSTRNRGIAFALLVPFLVFAVAPANVRVYHPNPALDGFGIYNRHGALLLYVLVSGLVFLKDDRKLSILSAGAMLALFLTKITAFFVGGLFGVVALLAGRMSLPRLALAIVLFTVPLVAVELASGMISAYISDIGYLAVLNEESLLPRFLTVVSMKLDVLLPAAILAVILLWWALDDTRSIGTALDSSVWWFSMVVAGGIVYETQNTGSQEFIFVWPVLLMIYERVRYDDQKKKIVFLSLAAFCAIPTFTKVVHKTLRAFAVLPTYDQVDVPLMKNIQQVASRPDIIERAKLLEAHYRKYRDAYEDLAANGQLPSWQYYSELDFQIYWIISANDLVESLLKFERDNGVRLNSILNIDFVNPFPWVMGREAPRYVQIGADPHRTVPEMTPETKQAIMQTDAILLGRCPITVQERLLLGRYADALQNRKVIQVHPCWDLLLRPGILKSDPR